MGRRNVTLLSHTQQALLVGEITVLILVIVPHFLMLVLFAN